MKSKKVNIISLGCPKNLIDSETMAGTLIENGYDLSPCADDAHIIVINTCAFILPAKEESIDEILRMGVWKREEKSPCTHLIVTGCLPQRYGRVLEKEIPEVDLFLGVNEVPNIARHLDRLSFPDPSMRRCIVSEPTFLMNAGHSRFLSTPSYTAYVKIAEGCSNRCSYCVIPEIRGKSRSREPDDILREAEGLAAEGVREIIITAQDTTAYGRDLKGKPTLSELLKKLGAIDHIRWIRLLYTYPAHLTHAVLKTMAAEEKICHYIDMPIQHIDDDILNAMNRRGGSRLIQKTVEKARHLIPDVALRTSIIVGFPGETRLKFDDLMTFIKEMRFDHLGVFTYSREEGTKAASLPSRISEKEKERRRRSLMEAQAIISYEINQALIGSHQEVLIEGKSDIPDFTHVGRCRRQSPDIDGVTYVRGKSLVPGDLALCRITGAAEYDLFAEIAL